MPFTDIQGQESAVATLRNALARDRLGHAYLFLGPAGVGKKHTDLTLAQAVLCSDTPREGCGTCPACATVVAGTHPDVIVVALCTEPQSVVIDQVRDLQRLLGLRSVRGGKKVALRSEERRVGKEGSSGG